MGFTHEEIESMILNGDYDAVSDFQEETFVGTGCGRCQSLVDDMFARKNRS
jgi:bacterioferritin-associated ferredoxin